jgi:putative transposase
MSNKSHKSFKSYKVRIYPTNEQKILLSQSFGNVRFVYNYFLNKSSEDYKINKTKFNYYVLQNQIPELKEKFQFLKKTDSASLQRSLGHLSQAYKNFFKNPDHFGYPTFKKKFDKQSYETDRIKIKNDRICLAKFKDGFKFRTSKKYKEELKNGKINFCTVSKTSTNKYYVSINCEFEHKKLEKNNSPIGIDLGLKNLAILSNEKVYENNRHLRQNIQKIKYLNRQASKKTKGSNNKKVAYFKLAKQHEKIKNRRVDHLQKITIEIVKNHDIIVIEDLSVKNMVLNHKLAQSLSDAALGTFRSLIEAKCSMYGRTLVKVDRYFTSSKICNNCKVKNVELQLKDRTWTCKNCGSILDRDINASKNILEEGLKNLNCLKEQFDCGSELESQNKQKCGEASTQVESMNHKENVISS